MVFSRLLLPRNRQRRLNYFLVLASGMSLEACAAFLLQRYGQLTGHAPIAWVGTSMLPLTWIMVCNDLRRMRDLGWPWPLAIPMAPVYCGVVWMAIAPTADENLLLVEQSFCLYGFWTLLFLLFGRGMPETVPGAAGAPEPLRKAETVPVKNPRIEPLETQKVPIAVDGEPASGMQPGETETLKGAGAGIFADCGKGHYYEPRKGPCPFCLTSEEAR
jgi:hypothetical protein